MHESAMATGPVSAALAVACPVFRFLIRNTPAPASEAAWRIAQRRLAWHNQVPRITRTRQGIRLKVRLSDGAGGHIYFRGIHEPELEGLLSSALQPGDTFLDIGANIGYFSLLAAKRVGPTGRVFAVEPVPSNIDAINENLALNPKLEGILEIIPFCATDAAGEVVIHLPPKNCGEATLMDKAGKSIPVRAVRLDSIIDAATARTIRVVKVDIEGAEGLALRGMLGLLPSLELLVVEIHEDGVRQLGGSPDEILEYMRMAGFSASFLGSGGAWSPGTVFHHPTAVLFQRR